MNTVRGKNSENSATSLVAKWTSNGMRLLPLRVLGALKLVVLTLAFSLTGLFGGKVSAEIIVRSFNAENVIEPGKVVALSLRNKSTVELVPANNPARIYGVAIDPKTAPATISQPGQKVFVAISGVYPVQVSTENGSISNGDYLSMSSSDGVAAKTTNGQTYIVGWATQSFSGTIGQIAVQLKPGRDPRLGEDTAVPKPLRQLAEAIAGKPLSASRIYAALIIFFITAAMAFGLLWVGVRSGMIAIGRNPLSKHSIMQSLTQVILAAFIVFVGGLLGIYLLLRL